MNKRKTDMRSILTILTVCSLLVSLGYNIRNMTVMREVNANTEHIEEVADGCGKNTVSIVTLGSKVDRVETKVDMMRDEQVIMQQDVKTILRYMKNGNGH